uniref:Zeta toxin domain-containing protein n=1 Tax=Helicotheca tamesis TaxID=374047 RepID=A0A7S2I1W7_9STRA|mmetsp:Transcript_4890/g.6711  ORF Transcript_4890/g.6711 Transcript_4890/m.6711 type:complete len:498 (+) Transcript_4890:135-1628(+)
MCAPTSTSPTNTKVSKSSSTTTSSSHSKVSIFILVLTTLFMSSRMMDWIRVKNEDGQQCGINSQNDASFFGSNVTKIANGAVKSSASSSVSWTYIVSQLFSYGFQSREEGEQENSKAEELEKWVTSFGFTNRAKEYTNCGDNKDERSSIIDYPLHLSTEEHHTISLPHHPSNTQPQQQRHYGKFASIRSTLDYTYHGNYTQSRQILQDSIIESFLNTATIIDSSSPNSNHTCTTPSSNPWIVFTAGAMGAGKSYTIKHLHSTNRFPLNSFVTVDPDDIRRHLPEFHLYAKHTPQYAGERTRKEAGYISEILTLVALQNGMNVLVDGSLRDYKWYTEYFGSLRREYEEIQIGILHIIAPRDAVFERAEIRSKMTGRIVPRATLEEALEQVPKSIQILGPLSDFFAELNNSPDNDDIELMTEGLSWDEFRRQWDQTCLLEKDEERIEKEEEIGETKDESQRTSRQRKGVARENNEDAKENVSSTSTMASIHDYKIRSRL